MNGISLSKVESVALVEGRLFQLRRAVLSDKFPYGKVGSTLFVREWWWSCYDGLDDVSFCKTFADKKPLRCVSHFESINPSFVALMPPRSMDRQYAQNFLKITYIKRQSNLVLKEEDFLLEGGRKENGWFLGSKHSVKGTSKAFYDPHNALYSFFWDRDIKVPKETFSSQESWLIGIQKEDFSSTTVGQQVV